MLLEAVPLLAFRPGFFPRSMDARALLTCSSNWYSEFMAAGQETSSMGESMSK